MWLRAVGKVAIHHGARRDQAMTPDRNALDHHRAGSDVAPSPTVTEPDNVAPGRDMHGLADPAVVIDRGARIDDAVGADRCAGLDHAARHDLDALAQLRANALMTADGCTTVAKRKPLARNAPVDRFALGRGPDRADAVHQQHLVRCESFEYLVTAEHRVAPTGPRNPLQSAGSTTPRIGAATRVATHRSALAHGRRRRESTSGVRDCARQRPRYMPARSWKRLRRMPSRSASRRRSKMAPRGIAGRGRKADRGVAITARMAGSSARRMAPFDCAALLRAVDHARRARPALLPDADIDRRRAGRRRLDDAARRIADHDRGLLERGEIELAARARRSARRGPDASPT